jgi:hypothetical protein
VSRVDWITITLNVYQEFEGHTDITFEYSPTEDDPFTKAVLDKLHERNQKIADAIVKDGPGETLFL